MGIQTTVDTGGHVRIVRQRNTGVMPQHTEELRTVLRVEGNMWTMLASKFKNKPFFANMTPDIWLGYVNYLLGEKVYLMQVPAGGKGGKLDQAPLRPPWVVILNYEYELRKEAVKRAYRDSRPLRDTLREVTEDAQLKEQYFASRAEKSARPVGLSHAPNWGLVSGPLQQLCCRHRNTGCGAHGTVAT